MDRATERAVQDALSAVLEAATKANGACELGEAKAALNAVWFATHKAQETINEAEKATRRAALDRIARTFA